jgi:hypothetical protein
MYEGTIHLLRSLVPVCHVQVSDETAFFQWFQEKLKKQEWMTFIYTGRDHGKDPIKGNQNTSSGWMRIDPYLKALGTPPLGDRLCKREAKFDGGPVEFETAVMSAMALDPLDGEAFFLVPQCEAKLSDPRIAAWVRRFIDQHVVESRAVRLMVFTGTKPVDLAESLQGHVEMIDERPSQEPEAIAFLKNLMFELRLGQDIEPLIPLFRGMSRAQIMLLVTQSIVHTKKTETGKEIVPELVQAFRTKIGLDT